MLAIATEWLCYKCFTTDAHYPRLGDILLANLVSWLVGIVLCAFLPTGLVLTPPHGSGGQRHLTTGPHFASYAVLSFFVACVLSIVIEFWSIKLSTRKLFVGRLFRLSAIANTAGYMVLGVVSWIWVTWLW